MQDTGTGGAGRCGAGKGMCPEGPRMANSNTNLSGRERSNTVGEEEKEKDTWEQK